MTIRLITLAANNTVPILERMKAIAGDELDVVFQMGSAGADIKASSISKMSAQSGRRGHIMQNAFFTGAKHDVVFRPDFHEGLEEFIDHLQRRAPAYRYTSHNIQNMQDYIDYYNVLLEAACAKILETGATHMLFFNIPHMGYDTVFYHAGRALGLKSVLMTQSLFPNKFVSTTAPEHFGEFSLEMMDAEPFNIESPEQLDLFYMKGISQEQDKSGRITARTLWSLFLFLLNKAPGRALNPIYLYRTLKRMQIIYGKFPKWRDPFARFFHENNLAYFEHLAEYENHEVDLSQRFVYFPLQLQPEMTTSALGGVFKDQALAIEELARILPADVKIYVKENPKQLGFMRGPLFFHRLNRIPNVEIMPSHANTHALSDSAEFVATITGTVGWEAICKGKPALVFGNAWYKTFPGVVRYREDLVYEDIIGTRPEHAKLEAAVGAFLARCHDGVVLRHYRSLLPDYDVDRNADMVARTALALLRGEVEVTFPGREETSCAPR